MPDLPELVLESRTQSAETIEKIMDDLGYETVEASETTDGAPAKSAEEPPAEKKPKESPAPAAAPSVETPAGDEVEDETGQETPAAAGGEPAQQEKKKGKTARRIERYRSEADSLRAENEELKRKLVAPAAQPAATPPVETAAPKPPVADDPEPSIEQFQDQDDPYAAWVKAQARWAVRDERRQDVQRDQDRRASEESARRSQVDESARSAADAEQKLVTERWNANATQARASHPDFDEVLKRPFPQGNPVLANIANDYDEVAEIVYYMLTHPEEATFIASQTRLPENFSQLGPRARQRAIYVAETAAKEAFDQILPKLAAPSPAPAPGTAASRETPAAAAPPASVTPPAAAPPARAIPPRPKAEPPKPVGNRGGSPTRRYEDMTPAEQRALSIEEVRRLRNLTSV